MTVWIAIVALTFVLMILSYQLWNLSGTVAELKEGLQVLGTQIGSKGMGSVHWEVEAMARRIEELTERAGLPPVQWNRDENGMILGIQHEFEVTLKSVGQMDGTI